MKIKQRCVHIVENHTGSCVIKYLLSMQYKKKGTSISARPLLKSTYYNIN